MCVLVLGLMFVLEFWDSCVSWGFEIYVCSGFGTDVCRDSGSLVCCLGRNFICVRVLVLMCHPTSYICLVSEPHVCPGPNFYIIF